jgi:hypothetical protein
VYSPAIYNSLIDARIEDLHRAARPLAISRSAKPASGKIRHWTAALANYLKPVRRIPVHRHAH